MLFHYAIATPLFAFHAHDAMLLPLRYARYMSLILRYAVTRACCAMLLLMLMLRFARCYMLLRAVTCALRGTDDDRDICRL